MKTANATSKGNASATRQLRRILEDKSTERRAHLRVPTENNPMLHAIDAVLCALCGEYHSLLYRKASSTSVSQSGRFSTSRGFGPSAAPTMPSCSMRSMRWAARP